MMIGTNDVVPALPTQEPLEDPPITTCDYETDKALKSTNPFGLHPNTLGYGSMKHF